MSLKVFAARQGAVLPVLLVLTTVLAPRTRGQGLDEGGVDKSLDSLLNVTVSGASKYEKSSREAPASVTVVTAEEIRIFGYRTLAEVLRAVRGFYVSDDHNYTYVGVRGFGRPTDYNSRLLLLLNGHIMNESTFGSAYLGSEFPFDLSMLDRVEVIRGPASSLYGTGGMFGVINLVTRRGTTLEGITLRAEAGSPRMVRGSIATGSELGSGWSCLLSVHGFQSQGEDLYFREFDVPGISDGIANGVNRDRSIATLGELRFDGTALLGGLSTRSKILPTAPYGTLFNDRRTRTTDRLMFLKLTSEHELSAKSHITLRGYFDRTTYDGWYAYDGALLGDQSVSGWAGAEAQYRWDPFSDLRLTAGAEYRRSPASKYRSWDDTTEYVNKNVPFTVLSGYLEGEFLMSRDIALTAGARYDSYSSSVNSIAPRAALLFFLSDKTTAKLLYGEAFRAPNVYEQNYEDPISGFKLSTGLSAERIRAVEAVLDHRLGPNIFGTLSLYNYAMRDLIDPVVDPADSLQQFSNRSRVRAYGAELELLALFGQGCRYRMSYSYQRALDPSSGKTLSNSPQHALKLHAACRLAGWLTAGSEILYESSRLTVQETSTPAFWLVNVTLGTALLADHFRVSLSVRNLFGAAIAVPGGFEHVQAAIPQEGRTYLVTTGVEF